MSSSAGAKSRPHPLSRCRASSPGRQPGDSLLRPRGRGFEKILDAEFIPAYYIEDENSVPLFWSLCHAVDRIRLRRRLPGHASLTSGGSSLPRCCSGWSRSHPLQRTIPRLTLDPNPKRSRRAQRPALRVWGGSSRVPRGRHGRQANGSGDGTNPAVFDDAGRNGDSTEEETVSRSEVVRMRR